MEASSLTMCLKVSQGLDIFILHAGKLSSNSSEREIFLKSFVKELLICDSKCLVKPTRAIGCSSINGALE